MFTGIFSALRPASAGGSSDFSKFFREASSREKKRVFLDVARKASKEQRDVIQASQRTR